MLCANLQLRWAQLPNIQWLMHGMLLFPRRIK